MKDLPKSPLGRFRVLDLTQVLSGPHCTQMLADLGADVVKVERPGFGDDLRNTLAYEGREDHQDYFYANNRSKRSIALDLKSPRDRDVAHALAKQADIVVENFAPGTAARLDMAWEDLQAINPRLVYCSISGFGQTGPARDRLALDPVIQAIAGVMSVTGAPGTPPMQIGAPLADVMAGMYAAYAIVGALHGVRDTGEGRYIDISMQDTMLAALGPRMGETLQAGRLPQRQGNGNPLRVPAESYRTADGRYIAIICMSDRFWPPVCRAVGRDDLIDDPRYTKMADRVADRSAIDAMLSEIFVQRTADEWVPILETERVPFARVNDYAEALSDPQVEHRGLVRELQHATSGAIRVVGPPWQMSGDPLPSQPPPLLGEHTADVLHEWLEWDDEKIAAFGSKCD
ncbi:MAG: CoA transferase [Alphaproteobacteria bacterium]|nr:CoA transferase [Alphaproteobacteria bacterium]